MLEQSDNKLLEESIGNDRKHEIERSSSHREESPSQRRERSAKKPRESKKREPEKVYFLVSVSEKSYDIVAEADLPAAGARVVSDDNLKLFEAVPMEPKITF